MVVATHVMSAPEARRPARLGIILALVVALGLVGFGAFAAARRWGTPEAPHFVTMAESAQTMQRAGEAMQVHGQVMLVDGRRLGDPELIAHGEHWTRDSQALLQNARWMAANPTSTIVPPAGLAAQGSWGELNRTAQAMLHDPRGARQVDMEALRWTGLAMRGEGQNMVEHGRVMSEETELMVARHGLAGASAEELRQAASAMVAIGALLRENGQSMVDYADRLHRVNAMR